MAIKFNPFTGALETKDSKESFSTEEKAKLLLIEDEATADQTGAEIKALYEAEADTNAYTDAEQFLVSTALQPDDIDVIVQSYNSIPLTESTTWYIAADGNANNDGLNVGTPISMAEAARRVYRVVPTVPNRTLTLSIADGVYNTGQESAFDFNCPLTEYGFSIWALGGDWVGITDYPGAVFSSPLAFYNFKAGSVTVENIQCLFTIVYDSYIGLNNIAVDYGVNLYGVNTYAYASGKYKFNNSTGSAFSLNDATLRINDISFDSGGTTRNFYNGFIELNHGAVLDLTGQHTVVGTFTGDRLFFGSPNVTFMGDIGSIEDLPGDANPEYPDYLFSPNNPIVKTSEIGVTVQPYDADTVIDANYVATENNYSNVEKDKVTDSYFTTTGVKTSNYTANTNELIPCDTTGGSFTVTLPATGKVKLFDKAGNSKSEGFGINSIFLEPAGASTVMGDDSLEIDIGATSIVLELIGTDWRIIGGIQ